MKNLLLSLSFILSFFEAFSQSGKDSSFNLGYEQIDEVSKLPANWMRWGDNCHLAADSVIKAAGKYSMRIELEDPSQTNTFSSAAYMIPAEYEGRVVELKGKLKMENVANGFAGLLMRVDGESGVLKFDNMKNKKLQGSSDWQTHSIKLQLPEDAKKIYVGAILVGTGKIWVDDFELRIDGKDLSKAKRKVAKEYLADKDHSFDGGSKVKIDKLTPQTVENLVLLGKLWGFLKYYHPEIAEGNYNWDYELFRIMPKVLQVAIKEERNEVLSDWIQGLGTIKNFQKDDPAKIEAKVLTDLDWITEEAVLGKKLVGQLDEIRRARRSETHYYISLYPGVGNPNFKNEAAYADMNYSDVGYRLLGLFRYWNMIQYFFPYKYLTDKDWNEVLPATLPKFVEANDELTYKLALLELIGQVQDTHANIWQDKTINEVYRGKNYAPLEVSFVENKAVITDFLNEDLAKVTGLQKGDVLLAINGKSVDEVIKARLPYTPASNYPTQLRDISWNLLRTNDSLLTVEFERNGEIRRADVECYSAEKANKYRKLQEKDTCSRFLAEDIGYIYPGSIKNKYLPDVMEAFKNTKGIVVDLRCYPLDFVVFSLGKYLMPEATDFVKFTYVSIENPGMFILAKGSKVGVKNNDYYKGKVIILINETTQSQAEYTTMALRVAPNATVVGSTTAGADGNVSFMALPGGVRTSISGIGVYYPDGGETQRVGIVPDVEVKPTIIGIKEGRDELLEKAIEIIRN